MLLLKSSERIVTPGAKAYLSTNFLLSFISFESEASLILISIYLGPSISFSMKMSEQGISMLYLGPSYYS